MKITMTDKKLQTSLSGLVRTLEPEPEPEAIFNIAGFEISQKHFVAAVGGAIVILIIIVAITLAKRKKEAEADRPDPDADYDEKYGDEIEIPEGTFEDDDFEV